MIVAMAFDRISGTCRRRAETLGLPTVSFHALRRTHASQLIASGLDIK
jgi:integrase